MAYCISLEIFVQKSFAIAGWLNGSARDMKRNLTIKSRQSLLLFRQFN